MKRAQFRSTSPGGDRGADDNKVEIAAAFVVAVVVAVAAVAVAEVGQMKEVLGLDIFDRN